MERTEKHFRKRDAILACLRATDTHPSADWVHTRLKEKYPDISLGTVYRNLSLFKEQGVIVSVGTVKGVERFDADISPHVHFVCTGCGCVRDLPGLRVPEELVHAASRISGGEVTAGQLTFTGSCEACKPTQMEETI